MNSGPTGPRPTGHARPTVRWKLTLLYSLIFLACAAALLAITYGLFANFAYSPPKQPGNPVMVQVEGAMSVQRSIGLNRLKLYSAIALAFMTIVSVALGWLVAGRALARLEAAFDAQRRFVANASHELRTPLAMMRTTLDVAIAKPGGIPAQTRDLDAELRVDLDHADDLLESFLALARAQDGRLGDREPVALAPLVRSALGDRAEPIAARRLSVTTGLDEVEVPGSCTLLRRTIENVVDNAVRHTPPGGVVEISLAASDDGRASLVVSSSGPSLDPRAVAQLARPFRRLRQDRVGSQDGHGLGLSIVAAVAAAHGGRLDLQARPEGGLRVALTLPGAVAVPLVPATS